MPYAVAEFEQERGQRLESWRVQEVQQRPKLRRVVLQWRACAVVAVPRVSEQAGRKAGGSVAEARP